MFIWTTGIGIGSPGIDLSGDRAQPGDRVILFGTIGDHGVATMSLRANLGFKTAALSDGAALHGPMADMVYAAGAPRWLLRDREPSSFSLT